MVGVGVYTSSPSPCSNLQREIILQSVQGGVGVVGVGRCCGLECVSISMLVFKFIKSEAHLFLCSCVRGWVVLGGRGGCVCSISISMF